ncbi:transcriptional activator hap3 [Recurvomyces mirabilis]|uniref:Transcriptional activator hap3 n=1 Tax=Recurvomyces mirabilis TaxID=574656 RepID=A0AAE0WQI0_9PEZI|nr:transcriptional activator hap3 [Recurvomyces mirabilis]KAK5155867.1 transcriptional activator hap3 [Recurvomyces mirabilis]
MSDESPRETEELDAAPPSGDENEPQQQESEMNRNDDPHDAGYDFEVKEQDRWLPIANGVTDGGSVENQSCLRLRYHSTYNTAARVSSARTVESEVQRSAYDLRPPTRAAVCTNRKMPSSSSPQSSASPPSRGARRSPHAICDNDANIHNFAPVARIMKMALPENAKIAKEAKECMQECVSEFISFITSEASEKCQQEKRKTVNGEDILFAMTSLGFENYGEALKIYLARYRENLLARGDQKPATTSAATDPIYENSNHNVLANPMDPTGEVGPDFSYPSGHVVSNEY